MMPKLTFQSVRLAFVASILTIISQTASAAQSQAQLYLPWPMLISKISNSTHQGSQHFSTKVPASTLTVNGIDWSVGEIHYEADMLKPVIRTDGKAVSIELSEGALEVRIGNLNVNQVIERDMNGTTVRVHLQAECSTIVLRQSQARLNANFLISWDSGSPVPVLKSSDLSWPDISWEMNDFSCKGPEGLTELIRSELKSRLATAADFKPYLDQFLVSEISQQVASSLNTIREPFNFKTASSRQIFEVGKLTNLTSGVVAEITISTSKESPLPALPLPSQTLLSQLPQDRPTLLASNTLLEQIIRSELSAKANSVTVDLQSNASFHALMQSRLKQFFVWNELRHFSKNSPFPLTLFKPNFEGTTLSADGKIKTSFNFKGLIQAYREGKWWNWIAINGRANADIKVSISGGKISYQTAISVLKNTKIEYTTDYTSVFKKKNSPPGSKILAAVSGNQPTLSGSFNFPVIDLGAGGKFNLSQLKWLSNNSFALSFEDF